MFQQKIFLLALSIVFLLSLAVVKPGENFPVSGRTNSGNLYCPEPPRFGEHVKTTDNISTENTSVNDQSWLDEVKKNIQKEEYDFVHSDRSEGKFRSVNRSNNMKFEYLANGFTASVLNTKIPLFDEGDKTISEKEKKYKYVENWEIKLKINSVNRKSNNTVIDDEITELNFSELITTGNKAYSESENMRIDYTNDESGMRQDFIIKKRPQGAGRLSVNLSADTKLRMIAGSDALMFKDNKGEDKMKYSALKAWDANGKELRAYFEKSEYNKFRICVNDDNAEYPVTIDPLSASPNWVVNFGYSFGSASSAAGDINGDGYGDVIVGAKATTTNFTNDGKVYLFLGSATGLSTTPAWSGTGANQGSSYGHSLATAGDVNGDGFSDIIIGEPGFKVAGISKGRALLYYGSPSGLPANPDWTVVGNSTDLGRAVSTAGDVNGDGYSDVIVSTAYGTIDSAAILGGAFLYLGSSNGLSSSSVWQVNGTQYFENFGNSVCTAGDINGDGYSDVIIGAPEYSLSSSSKEGAAYAYYGSTTGLSDTANWFITGQSPGYKFGFSVYTAGDVNGDGYSDVIAGAPDSGKAFVFHGSAAGLSVTSNWTASGLSNSGFGYSVAAAGDYNGDGFSDIVAGAPGNTGQAFVYSGSPAGLSSNSVWSVSSDGSTGSLGFSVRTAGDVNGDGYSDLLVCGYSPKAYVYNGSPAGFVTAQNWSYNGVSGAFGWTVASAGDINGDGYSDVIIGAPDYNNGTFAVGRFFIFHGSSAGLSSTPNLMKTGSNSGNSIYRIGRCVASAGDVNGDGYSDLIVGVTNGVFASYVNGGAEVYYGSASGISSTPSWTKSSAVSGDDFGTSVASAGDVNGDGYSDILVGAYKNNSESGVAYSFYGSAAGPSANADWSATGTSGSWYGYSLAGAGDVNGDGYGDVIIGAPKQSAYGAAFVYHGSGSGISTTPDWQFTASIFAAQSMYGISVACAGDVNGDGYSDILVGASKLYQSSNVYAGGAFGYYGSAGGLPAFWNWSENAPDPYFGHDFGWCVSSAGDVNGDGYSDVIICAPYPFGNIYCYYGSGSGLPYSHNTQLQYPSGLRFGYSAACAGDVNGDGYSDIIAGAYFTSGGSAYIFNGNSTKGNSSFVQQYKAGSNNLIGPGGLTTNNGQVKLGIFSKSPFGRADGKIIYEHKLNGTSFSPLTNTSGSGTVSSYQDAGFSGSVLNATVSGFQPGKSYKWRARVEYNPVNNPFQKLGPWRFYNSQNPLPFEGFRSICLSCSSTLNLRVIPQGFYNASNNLNMKDTVRVYLHSSVSPYNVVDSSVSEIDSLTLTGSFIFPNAQTGTYYIVVKHRNSIETWSRSGGEVFTNGTTMNYDYIDQANKAFGGNMAQVSASPVRFAIYSGDINQDGTIDASDVSETDNDAFSSVSGYVNTDLTGDDFVDAGDVSIVDNNAFNSVSVITP